MNVIERIRATWTFWQFTNTEPRGATCKPKYPYQRYKYGLGTYPINQAHLIRQLLNKFGFKCSFRGRGSRVAVQKLGIQLNHTRDMPLTFAKYVAIYVDVPNQYEWKKMCEEEYKRKLEIYQKQHPEIDVNAVFE